MPHNLTVSEQLCYSTVRIECDGGTGTAFFYQFPINENTHVPLLVTNKHVVRGAQRGRILLHLADQQGAPNGKHLGYELTEFEQNWRPHPDAAVDLCAMPIGPVLHHAAQQGAKPFYIAFDPASSASAADLQDLSTLEDIVMVGYPNGIWDRVNNMPVFRRGVTATRPSLDYDGRPEFMIDAACFPGSSGSPVVLYNIGAYATRQGVQLGGTRVKLLGILYAGPQHTAEGELEVVTVPTQQQRVVTISRIPNNLGVVIKATKLEDFRPMFVPAAQQAVAADVHA